MAKKLIAVTGVKHNGETFEAGTELDPSKFSKQELKELHDNGAIVLRDDSKPEDTKVDEGAAPAAPTSSTVPSGSVVPPATAPDTSVPMTTSATPAKDATAKK